MPALTVIVCSHNPRSDSMRRVLEALRGQTLDQNAWALLIIDNASDPPLRLDLSWHPQANIVREEQLGLTPARLRGIKESAGEVLVFVDDDNVLHPDYLETAAGIANTHARLGTWGAGVIAPQFETPAPDWAPPFLHLLTLRNEQSASWGNAARFGSHIPFGAGLCARRAAALHYAGLVEKSEFRKSLGRRGTSLVSGEDLDLVFTGCDMGFGAGVFPELKLDHLIPASRLEKAYLLKLAEEHVWTVHALESLRGQFQPAKTGAFPRFVKLGYYFLHLRGVQRDFFFAEMRGERRARRDFGKMGHD